MASAVIGASWAAGLGGTPQQASRYRQRYNRPGSEHFQAALAMVIGMTTNSGEGCVSGSEIDMMSSFRDTLVKEVHDYFTATGHGRCGGRTLIVKASMLLLWCGTSYWLLVFHAHTLWQATVLSLSLGASIAGIGFNISHDAMHNTFFASKRLNRLLSLVWDLMGVSSYFWHWKHNVIHHGHTNVVGIDSDINPIVFRGLSPDRPHRGFYRLQHIYLWCFYGLVVIKWQLVGDFTTFVMGRIGNRRIRRPGILDSIVFLAGKALFFLWALWIPLRRHSLAEIGFFYLLSAFFLGLILSTVFQLAHCVQEAAFVLPNVEAPSKRRHGDDWAVHQVESTIDFSQDNKLFTWFLGGLNFQIEHHLFPTVCHVHYRALAPVVERCCARWGIRYSHLSTGQALASHYRFLRDGCRQN